MVETIERTDVGALPLAPRNPLPYRQPDALVSVLTVLELTKQTQIFATNIGSWIIPGLFCAALYLAMSLPLAALARRLEKRWKAPTA